MDAKNRLPVVMLKLPGQPAIMAGIVATSVARDGQTGSVRQSFDVTYDNGKARRVFSFNTVGLIAKHVRGVGPAGATKTTVNGASSLDDARFYIVYPKTGFVRPVRGKAAVTERNGLNVITLVPLGENNPAKTGLGDHETTPKFADALPRKIKAGREVDYGESDYGLDDSLILELLGIVDSRNSQPADGQPADSQPADGQTASQPEANTASQPDGQPLTPATVGAATD